jgi:hypothetical protein
MREPSCRVPGVDANSPPPGAGARLERLRALHVPERDADARRRLASERPRRSEPLAVAAARRLRELSALHDLAVHLHRRA